MASETKKLPNIPTLPFKRPTGSETFFFIGMSGPDAPGQPHGFGILVVDEQGLQIAQISFRSNSANTTGPRGTLGGVLTCLEFVDVNIESGGIAVILSLDQFVWKWLKSNISLWIEEGPKRPNRDILYKIENILNRLPEVKFQRPSNTFMKRMMEDAKDIATRARLGAEDAEVYFDDEDALTEEQINMLLAKRAMDRDKS